MKLKNITTKTKIEKSFLRSLKGANLNWRRTSDKKYPLEDQVCLIYFKHTGFSISEFNWVDFTDEQGNIFPELKKCSCFSSKNGWLSDEDVLWVPIEEIQIPLEYSEDKKWKKWDDPEKIYRYVIVKEDLNYKKNLENANYYNQLDLFVPKGSRIGIIQNKSWKNNEIIPEKYEYVWEGVYDDGKEKHIIYIATEQFEEEKT